MAGWLQGRRCASYLQTEKYSFTDFAPEVRLIHTLTNTHAHKQTHTRSIYANGMCALLSTDF